MLEHLPLLSLLIWVPIAGAIIISFFNNESRIKIACAIATLVVLITLVLCIPLYTGFDKTTAALQFVEHVHWIPTFKIDYYLGVDGIAMPMILLTVYTSFIVILAAWTMVKKNVVQYLIIFLIMQGTMTGVFAAADSVLFYFFWEGVLVPMYLAIGVWGGSNRSFAALKFFIYTFIGSTLLLIAIIYLRIQSGSFAIADAFHLPLPLSVQIAIFIAFFFAFAIKVPMWPIHTWLPLAHTEAPTGGSIILAALMLKLGTYGFLRFNLPIVPDACRSLQWVMIGLSLIAIVYIGLVTIVQTDMKKLIAYSSVAHMGFVTLGIFIVFMVASKTANVQNAALGLEGAMVQMVSHGFSSGALFLAFGMIYQQMHTRLIKDFGGIANTMPIFAAFFMLFAMTNVGLPGTSGFVGEFMVIMSSFKANFWIAFFAALTLILGAAYTLWMYRLVFYGEVANENVKELEDVDKVGLFMFGLLALAILFIGVYPNPLLDVFHASINNLLQLTLSSRI